MTFAAAVVRERQTQLAALLSKERKALLECETRLTSLELQLRESADRINALRAPREGQSKMEHTLELAALLEQEQAHRRRRGALVERITQLKANVRKLGAVVTQSQMSADYLA